MTKLGILKNPSTRFTQQEAEKKLGDLMQSYSKELKNNVPHIEAVAILSEISKLTDDFIKAGYNVRDYRKRCDDIYKNLENQNRPVGETKDLADRLFKKDPNITVNFCQL